jgi:hypothetical protein
MLSSSEGFGISVQLAVQEIKTLLGKHHKVR